VIVETPKGPGLLTHLIGVDGQEVADADEAITYAALLVAGPDEGASTFGLVHELREVRLC
jgi:hypothetical protein